jgi:hypothetical protein
VVEATVAQIKTAQEPEFEAARLLRYVDDIPILAASIMRNRPKKKKQDVDNPVQNSMSKRAADYNKEFEAIAYGHRVPRRNAKAIILEAINAGMLPASLKGKNLIYYTLEERRMVMDLIHRGIPAIQTAAAPAQVAAKSHLPTVLKTLAILGAAGLAGYGGYAMYKRYKKRKELEKKAGPIMSWILAKLKKKEEQKEEEKRPGPELTPTKKGPMPVNEMTGM